MKNIGPVILSITALVVGFLFMQSANTYIRYMGFRDCGMIAYYEETVEGGNAKARYPLKDVYDACLSDKGLKKSTAK